MMLGRLRAAGRLLRDGWLMLGLALLLFCLVEAGARLALLAERWASASSAADDGPIRADTFSDTSWVRRYYAEFDRSSRLRWRPYVYWRRKPYRGEYITVDSSGRRVTPPGAQAAGRPLRIFVFGGSTVWGTGARDAFTIPALIARDLRQRGVATEVTNFGESGYVSTQSLIALLLELRAGRRPDVVVFYDGINDTFSAYQQDRAGLPQNEANRASDFNLSRDGPARQARSLLRELARRSATVELSKRLLRGTSSSESLPAPPRPDSLAGRVVATYLGNLELLRTLGEHYGFESLAYWQPTIFQKPQLTRYESLERAKAADMAPFFQETYARLGSNVEDGPVRDLSRVFADRREPLYIDWMHPGETGNAVIAQRIAGDILATKVAMARTASAGRAPPRR